MPIRHRSLALVTGMLAVTILQAGSGRVTEDETEAAVRKLLDMQVEAWNRNDLDGFLDAYWHSPEVVFQSGADRFDGFEAMRARYRKTYQAEGRAMGQLAFSRLEVVALGPDSALARGHWQLTMPDGKRPGGLFTLILRRRPAGWRIVHDHTSS